MKVLFNRIWGLAVAVMLLSACGGSGGPIGGETTPPPSTGPVPANLVLFSDLGSLRSSGADTAKLTAIVKDANNVVIQNVVVNFGANSGSLSVTQPTTDATGQAKATLGTQGNPANRTILVTATVQGTSISASLSIDVTGTTLSVSGPASMGAGDTQPLTINLRDSDGTGISNQTIILTSALNNTFSNASPITDSTGTATVSYTGGNGGNETVNASALSGSVVKSHAFPVSTENFRLSQQTAGDIQLSTPAQINLSWTPAPATQNVTVAVTRGTINGTTSNIAVISVVAGAASFTVQATNAGPGVVTATTAAGLSAQLQIEYVATTPSSITVAASPTTIAPGAKKSNINAVVRDAAGNLVKNKTVTFSLTDVSGGSISPASAITDSNGLASAVYTSGNSSSAQNGVSVTAAVAGTGVCGSGGVCGTVTLTVANSPLFITLGTGNSILEPDDTTYAKNFAVFVTDAGGAPRPNQQLIITVTPVLPTEGYGVAYHKGYREVPVGGDAWVTYVTAQCQNEDRNLNGILDTPPDFDLNNNGRIEPGNQVGVPGSVTTDATGYAVIQLRYPQQYAYYMNVMIRATANVAGTESRAEQIWLLEGISTDFNKKDNAPPGVISPFGSSANCADTL